MREVQQAWIVADDPGAGYNGATLGVGVFRLDAHHGLLWFLRRFIEERPTRSRPGWRGHLEDPHVPVVGLARIKRQRERQGERRSALERPVPGIDEKELAGFVFASDPGAKVRALQKPDNCRDEDNGHDRRADKACALKSVLEGPQEPDQLPAQMIQPANGHLSWLVDEAAGSMLSKRILK